MRVLVTGAGGYTGSRWVQRLLADGHAVRALVRRPQAAPALRALGARVVIGDVTNRASIAGIAANVDIVYHLVGTLAGGAHGMRRVLVEGTRNLIDGCLAAGAGNDGPLRAFIFASNAVVYGDGAGSFLDEESPCRPTFPLGRLTLEAEDALRRAQLEHRLPVIMLRVGAIYGPGRLSSGLISQGRFRIIGSGHNYSSRIHIEDLLCVLAALGQQVMAAEQRPLGDHSEVARLYCVADHAPCIVDEYYGRLATLLDVAPPRHIPAWYARLRGRARGLGARVRGRAPFVDDNVIGLFTADLRLNCSRLYADLSLPLRYPSYREGLPASLAAERTETVAGCEDRAGAE